MAYTEKHYVKIILGLLAMALILGTAVVYFLFPEKYIALDINPSMELQVNRLNRVVSIEGANDDTKMLLLDYQPKGKPLNEVIDSVMERLVQTGYLADGAKNDVLITTTQDARAQKTLSQVSAQIEKTLQRHELSAEVLTQSIVVQEDLKKKAEEHHVSAGKMTVIDRLLEQDPSLTAQELATTRISDLMEYAVQHNISLEALEDGLDELEDSMGGDSQALEQLEDELEAARDASEKAEDAAKDAAEDAKDAADEAKDAADEAKDAADEAKEDAEDRDNSNASSPAF
ncbi:MAG: hypothetical protein RR075_02615 [Pygmaiobacter sp.]